MNSDWIIAAFMIIDTIPEHLADYCHMYSPTSDQVRLA
jgi:hypothetical protein